MDMHVSCVKWLVLCVLLWCGAESIDVVEERAWTVCLDSLWNSCAGRCGHSLHAPPYLCACDHLCLAYHDCCLDFDYECLYDFNRTRRKPDPQTDGGQMSCVGLTTNMEYGVLMVSKCANWWAKDNATTGRCISPHASSLKPVLANTHKTIYKNEDCAKCNNVLQYEPWTALIYCNTTNDSDPQNHPSTWLFRCRVSLHFNDLKSSKARACAYEVAECPTTSEDTSTSLAMTEDERKCPVYSKPIMAINNDQSTTYKNIHCARCNGHCFNKLYCPQWEVVPHRRAALGVAQTTYYEVGVSADTRTASLPNLPASFSILFFFNQHGYHFNMFSSHDEQWWDNCNNQIWDPFWETCRDVYCSAKFDLVNFRCIPHDGNSNGVDMINSTYGNITQLENVDVTQVQLVLHLQMRTAVNEKMEAILAKEFFKTLAEALNVTASRFTNYTSYNQSSVNGTFTKSEVISLVLLGQSTTLEPTIEKIVATLAYAVSLNQMWLQLNSSGHTVKIYGIQEKIIQIKNSTDNNSSSTYKWCADGRQIVYQNSEFTPIVLQHSADNISLHIYVNSTRTTYLPGQFIANILMAGPQGSPNVNISGVAIVCDRSSYNNSCLRVMIESKDYVVLPNDSILCCANSSLFGVYQPKDFDILPNGDALLCVPLPPLPTVNYHRLMADWRAQSYLTTILLSISSAAIVATIVTYLAFSCMRNVPGWTILNLCFCLLAFQLLYLSGMRHSVYLQRQLCKCVAVFLHWTILSAFSWMNVIAFDLYWTFSHLMMSHTPSKRPHRTIALYAAYSYGLSTTVVATCLSLDLFTRLDIGYGEGGWCWIGSSLTLELAFGGVIGLILLSNFVLYILTVCSIRRMAAKTKALTAYGVSRSRMAIYARISTVMGFSWAVGYLEGISSVSYATHDVFAYVYIFSNCLSGVFIFVAFVCNRKVIRLYRDSRLLRWLMAVELKECGRDQQRQMSVATNTDDAHQFHTQGNNK